MLSRFGEGLKKGKLSESGRYRVRNYQVPSLVLDRLEFFLAHDGKDTLWGAGRGVKFKVQRDDIGRAIVEVVEAVEELVEDLQRVMTWAESKHGV